MRRFLFVSHKPVFGGPENQALRLARPLEQRGWKTIVAVTTAPGNSVERLEAGGVEVVSLSLHRLKSGVRDNLRMLVSLPAEVRGLRDIMRALAIDLVVVPGLENPHAAVAARLERLPVVWQILGTRTPMAFRRAMLPVVRTAADSAMITGTTLITGHPGLSRLGPRLVPFFPPVDTELFGPDAARRAAARSAMGVAEDEIAIGSVANVNAQKDHMTFIRAAAEVRRLAPGLRTRFVIIGETSASQREYADAVWREATRLGLERGRDLIHIAPGGRVVEFASALDIFWLTSESRSEGVPTAMLEAMSLKTPVVATNVGGVVDVIVDRDTGILVETKDFRAIADRTVELASDARERERLGSNGRARVLRDARLQTCVDAHVRAFDLALQHRAARSRRRPIRRNWSKS